MFFFLFISYRLYYDIEFLLESIFYQAQIKSIYRMNENLSERLYLN